MNRDIEQFLAEVEASYDRRDAHALAALHHSNARYTTLAGGEAVGREALEAYFPIIFEASPDDIESETIFRQIEEITPELAVIDTRIQHYRTQDNTRAPVSIEGFTTVATKEDGRWVIAAVRGALVPKGSPV